MALKRPVTSITCCEVANKFNFIVFIKNSSDFLLKYIVSLLYLSVDTINQTPMK